MANPISINEQALILSLGIGILTSLILFTMSFAIERIQSETVEVEQISSQKSSSQEINNTLESYGTKPIDFDPEFDDEDRQELKEEEKDLLKKLNELNSQINEGERRENEFLEKRKKDLEDELETLKKKGIFNKRIIKEEGLEEFEPELEKLLNEDVDYSKSLQNLFNESKSLPQEIQQSPPPKPPRGAFNKKPLESIPEVDETISKEVQTIGIKPIEPVQESQTQSTYVKKLAALLSQNLDLDNETLVQQTQKIQYDVKQLEPLENKLQAKTQENLTQGQDKEEMPVLKKFAPAKEVFEKFAEKDKPSTKLTTSSEAISVKKSENQKKGLG